MSEERIRDHDRRIAEYLEKKGSLKNTRGELLITGMIDVALKDALLAKAVKRSGLSRAQLVTFYRRSINKLMPSPFVTYESVILAPTYLFLEKKRLAAALDEIASYLHEESIPLIERKSKALGQLLGLSQSVHDELVAENGKVDREIGQGSGYHSGCLSVMIIGVCGIPAVILCHKTVRLALAWAFNENY